jgi:TorA maturation chaperone TorD
MIALNPAELAEARHRTYTLLSQFYLRGVTPELAEVGRRLPIVRELLPRELTTAVFDTLQAQHYQLFSLNVLPYATLFRTAERELGHETTQQVAQLYLNAGYTTDGTAAADHLGQMVAFVAYLSGAEADAWQDGHTAVAQQLQQQLSTFLAEQLLPWLAPLAIAIRREEPSGLMYAPLTLFLLELLADHTAVLPSPTTSPNLPDPPDLLDNPDTRLKDIARYLLVPAYTGFFLSKASLNRWGRALELPHGFGSRRQMLTTLLETAGQYEQWEALVNLLGEEITWWQAEYEGLHGRVPPLAPYITPWQSRLRHCQENILPRLVNG